MGLPRVAIIHDWLVVSGGGEKVLSEIINVFPDADLFSVVDFLPEDQRKIIHNKKVTTTFVQRLPKAKTKYRNYLSLMTYAIEQLDVSAYDIVISSSHAVAKGIITGPDQLHICYCHSPIRYAWDMQHQYLKEANLDKGLKGMLARWMLHRIRLWDYRTANGVDYFVANSGYIARRIKKVYGRKADVIYPNVAVEDFAVQEAKEDFYFTASRMVPYKKIDLIVEAFSKMPDKKLVVIGEGPQFDKVKAAAKDNITLLGYQKFDVLKDHMARARAFVFAAEEDFGIVPVEAQACGTPVIAFGKGGSLETVRPLGKENPTGVFFTEQTVESICAAVNHFETLADEITPAACRDNAEKFSTVRFHHELHEYVMTRWDQFQAERGIVTLKEVAENV
ncbi:glycosyltransferase involved in cell wall biosynthesis [Erwinia toletana]|uniref:Glycosyltransferase involved in cell wall biosynthesis n=1 Tax=Winslowiella toletana TaxID=92490 RepID=A0ABS4P5W8_9GAMM|nr:glycosyltransferase family 4 protein [Winslowiella toletana]MBP2167486.1 glycosyltransferase involved in cell wall biosynthesis [Winslowiella toletana]